jgi:6,7-dimethyl-8-ribityllumazine synthase
MSQTPEKSGPVESGRELPDASFCIVATRFNSEIVEVLVHGAREALARHGVAESAIDVLHVPGAFELPLAALKAAQSGNYDGVIALGAVVRGGTPHFEYVSAESTGGLSRVALDTGVPVGNGVLTVDTMEQAVERAGGAEGHKGEEAALAAIEMVHLLRQIGS